MTFSLSDESGKAKIVKKTIDPAAVPKSFHDEQIHGTYNWFVRLWHAVRGYTANDIGRLKEAGVRLVENESDLKAADVRKKLAQAERSFAEAEYLRQAAALKRSKAEKKDAEAEAIRIKATTDALDRFSDAVSRIRQQGGDVAFSLEQLENLIRDGYKKHPEDPNIKNVAFQLGVIVDDPEIQRIRDVLSQPVDQLNLSVRTYNVMMAANIKTVGDLVKRDEGEMLKFRSFGRKSLQELTKIVEEKGVHFGMDVDKYLSGK